jgi:hypothetical protein
MRRRGRSDKLLTPLEKANPAHHIGLMRRRRPALPELPPETMWRRVARLSEAVRERRAVELLYGGAWRVVHPHAVGRTGTGRTGLLTWQTAGLARGPGNPGEGWRMFDVARIEDARILHATFTPRPRAAERWSAGLPAPVGSFR